MCSQMQQRLDDPLLLSCCFSPLVCKFTESESDSSCLFTVELNVTGLRVAATTGDEASTVDIFNTVAEKI